MSGGDLSLKTPVAYAANRHIAARVNALAVLTGKGLPCVVTEVLIGLVKVKFQVQSIFNLPELTMPVSGGTQFFRAPIQVGEVGRAIPTGVPLSSITGQATSTPNLGRVGNLETMAFEPLSGPVWPTPTGFTGAKAMIYGAGDGVVIQDIAVSPATVITITKDTIILKVATGKKVDVTAGGTVHPVSTTSGPSTVLRADA